jgi:sugar phosphate isomerase/epimerase
MRRNALRLAVSSLLALAVGAGAPAAANARGCSGADTLTAWRSGLFCALGQGHVDLAGFCRGVEELGYDGWNVVEQDRVLTGTADLEAAAADQVANRAWLREHCGW